MGCPIAYGSHVAKRPALLKKGGAMIKVDVTPKLLRWANKHNFSYDTAPGLLPQLNVRDSAFIGRVGEGAFWCRFQEADYVNETHRDFVLNGYDIDVKIAYSTCNHPPPMSYWAQVPASEVVRSSGLYVFGRWLRPAELVVFLGYIRCSDFDRFGEYREKDSTRPEPDPFTFLEDTIEMQYGDLEPMSAFIKLVEGETV